MFLSRFLILIYLITNIFIFDSVCHIKRDNSSTSHSFFTGFLCVEMVLTRHSREYFTIFCKPQSFCKYFFSFHIKLYIMNFVQLSCSDLSDFFLSVPQSYIPR